ncbi:MAG: pyridoxal phosphate-dependent aminotransferase [Bacteroidetes bacterium]|nr:pyridoxal phosphate-dependent aminotransferase [Bacteroidota bacterium]
MPKLSHKGLTMPASPIRKLVPYAEQAKKKGIKVYHLNIGQPDIEMPKEAIEAIQNLNLNILEYSHSAGNESYRKKLAEYYQDYGIQLDPAYNILVTTGGSEAITIALMSCMDPGDEIIVPEPLYANYNGFAIASDVIVKPITSGIENGFALPGIDAFEKLITPKTKAILICNPNNPTGYLYSKTELEALRDLALKHDLFIIADEVYRDFVYDGKEHISLLNIAGLEKHAIVIDSVSKRFSMCGARIGTLISYNKEFMLIALKFAQARLSPPSLGQLVAESALRADDAYFNEVNREYLSRRNLMVALLNQIDGVYCPTPGGAFYTIARLPIDDCDKFCQWLLESFSYHNETVMLAPATGFYSTKGLGKNEVRIAYVLNQTDLTHAIKCLQEALKVYPGKTN